MFERSVSGQANRALFYGVDYVCFVEGGMSDSENESFDLAFWRSVFRTLNPGKSVKFLTRGSKANLLPLAQDLADNDTPNTIIAMDRDWDEDLGTLIDHPRVIYTYGYSFETDIYQHETLPAIFYGICPLCPEHVNIETELTEWQTEFLKRMRWPHAADLLAKVNGIAGLSRDKPQQYFQSNAYGASPEISTLRLGAEVARIAQNCEDCRSDTLKGFNFSWRKLVGHIVEVFAFRCISHLHHRHSSTAKFSFDTLRSIAVLSFANFLMQEDTNCSVRRHYRQAVGGCFELPEAN